MFVESFTFNTSLFGNRQNSIHGGFTNAKLTGNTYFSGTLGRKPQNMLMSIRSDWFSTLVFASRLRFGDASPL